MLPLSQSWYYWAMAALLVAQVILSVNYHILVCNMPIANTLLLLVIMAHHGYALGDQARPLFHRVRTLISSRICGCVAFIAVLFVNTTHALELLTDYHDGHSHSHGDHEHHDEHHSEEYGFGFVPSRRHHFFPQLTLLPSIVTPQHWYITLLTLEQYVIVSIFDVALKCLVLALGHIPSMGLHPVPRLILHTLSPTIQEPSKYEQQFANCVLGMYVAGLAIPPWLGESWLWKHVDPVLAVTTTILFFLLIIPAFREMMPYIFADTPAKFHVESFQDEISTKFPDVTCTHIHAYRLWPGNQFEALIHLSFLKFCLTSIQTSQCQETAAFAIIGLWQQHVDKSKSGWSDEAAARYSEVSQNVTSVLSRAGAQKVVVEPSFLDATEIGRPWVGCVGATCFRQDRGCCKIQDNRTDV
ncbi:unnamed protein product [Strongylus vulgaris]|uniref:Uncharacterized protein n=1 Tax=Strongylus vulgaris TaxID=40348 RepID=A0A3P7J3K8_STRVU|nr:unnamed protein product [Strongylus vulgaris]